MSYDKYHAEVKAISAIRRPNFFDVNELHRYETSKFSSEVLAWIVSNPGRWSDEYFNTATNELKRRASKLGALLYGP